jgi:hypothetical protein
VGFETLIMSVHPEVLAEVLDLKATDTVIGVAERPKELVDPRLQQSVEDGNQHETA